MKRAQRTIDDLVDYPESDGRPMGETDWHRDLMFELIFCLRSWFARRKKEKAYVTGNIMVYYEKGDPTGCVSPDVMVVLGLAPRKRRTFKVWEEGRTPDVVIEITSRKTKSEDRNLKMNVYQDVLRVKEYFLFDPEGDWVKSRLRAYRLVAGEYQEVPIADHTAHSDLLGLDLRDDEGVLRLVDPSSSERLPFSSELESLALARERELRDEVERLRRRLGQR